MILESDLFEPCIALTILLNVITMAAASPLDPSGTPKAALIEVRSHIFSKHSQQPLALSASTPTTPQPVLVQMPSQ